MVSVRRALLALCVALFLLACTGCQPNDQPGDKFLAQLPRERQQLLAVATPEQVVAIYLGAVNEDEYDLALACLAKEAFQGSNTPDRYRASFEGIESITDIAFEPPGTGGAQQGDDTRTWVVVSFTQHARPGADVMDGPLMRFVELRRSDPQGRWRIVALNSSP